MTQQPRDGDGRIRDAVFRGDFVNFLVQLRELLVAEEDAFKETVLERRPRLNRDIVQAAEVQHAAVTVNGGFVFHIYVNAGRNHRRVRDAQLQLIGDDRLFDVFLQQLNLHRVLVGHAEMAYFARGMQLVERLRNLFGFYQGIGTMQQQHIEIFGFQTLQNAVHRRQNMLFREVKEPLADAAFRLQDDFLPNFWIHVNRIGENLLTGAAAVDIRVVKKLAPSSSAVWTKRSAPALSSELIRIQPTAMTGTSSVLVPSLIVFINRILLYG